MKKYLKVGQIYRNKLSNEFLEDAGIELIAPDEIFVKYPRWKKYYASNYGRLISLQDGVRLLNPNQLNRNGGDSYVNYKLSKNHGKSTMTISAHRLVADTFLQNYWKDKSRNQLQAHHLDHSKSNNYYRNLMLLPTNLHYLMNKLQSICVVVNGAAVPVVTAYDLISDNLTLDEIILESEARDKKVDTIDGYEIHELKGLMVGYQYTDTEDAAGATQE